MHRWPASLRSATRATKASPYLRWIAYGQTKLANLLFTFELDRRLRASGSTVSALAAHPGYAGTHLVANGASAGPRRARLAPATRPCGRSASPPATARWPPLMAATADLPGSTYFGPSGLGESAGAAPARRLEPPGGRPRRRSGQLWELCEQVTGVHYP